MADEPAPWCDVCKDKGGPGPLDPCPECNKYGPMPFPDITVECEAGRHYDCPDPVDCSCPCHEVEGEEED